jgi:hypothetical protein
MLYTPTVISVPAFAGVNYVPACPFFSGESLLTNRYYFLGDTCIADMTEERENALNVLLRES